MTTNVVIRRLVPVVSELGWDEVGMGGTYQGFVSTFVVWVPCCRQHHGTWFPLVGAGGFRGGGSHFCACGHHSCLFWGIRRCLGSRHRCLGSRTMMNNGFESVIRHLVTMSLSAMWHLGCVSVKRKDGGDLLCTVMMVGIVTIGWSRVVGVIGQASWMMWWLRKNIVDC